MANEIQIQQRVTVRKGHFNKTWDPPVAQVDQAGDGGFGATLSIGTSEEAITFTDVGTYGILCMQNLDDTNFVTYGPTSGGAMVVMGRLNPGGEPQILRLEPGITLRMKADTAACDVELLLLED